MAIEINEEILPKKVIESLSPEDTAEVEEVIASLCYEMGHSIVPPEYLTSNNRGVWHLLVSDPYSKVTFLKMPHLSDSIFREMWVFDKSRLGMRQSIMFANPDDTPEQALWSQMLDFVVIAIGHPRLTDETTSWMIDQLIEENPSGHSIEELIKSIMLKMIKGLPSGLATKSSFSGFIKQLRQRNEIDYIPELEHWLHRAQ